jgi:hypothetical protein
VDHFTEDAWNNPNNKGVFSDNNYPGEGMLFYPGEPLGIDHVVPSLRLKWIRDGVLDYEYAQILKTMDSALAMQIARSVGPDWRAWSRDPDAVIAARIRIGEAIQQRRSKIEAN